MRKIIICLFAAIVVASSISYLIVSRAPIHNDLEQTMEKMRKEDHEISEKFSKGEVSSEAVDNQTVGSESPAKSTATGISQ